MTARELAKSLEAAQDCRVLVRIEDNDEVFKVTKVEHGGPVVVVIVIKALGA